MSHPKDPHDPNYNPNIDDTAQTTAKQTADVISTVLLTTGIVIVTAGGLFSAGPVATLVGAVLIGTGFLIKP